jgi:hypothetical protein
MEQDTYCRQSDGKRVKDGHDNAKKSKRVIPALDQADIETATTLELNETVTLIQRSVDYALSKHPAAGEGSVAFSHTEAGLIMTCKGKESVVYSNEVYNAHIHRVVSERKTAIAPAMMPMLVRALTQYLVHRAMQCIGGGKCDPSTPGNELEGKPMITCGNELTNEMVKDMSRPEKEDGSAVSEAEFLECMRGWITGSADPNFSVEENKLRFHPGQPTTAPAAAPVLSVDLVGVYDIRYTWIVLHLFMAYVNGRVAQDTGTADAHGLTQRNLHLLLEPFKVKGDTPPPPSPPPSPPPPITTRPYPPLLANKTLPPPIGITMSNFRKSMPNLQQVHKTVPRLRMSAGGSASSARPKRKVKAVPRRRK